MASDAEMDPPGGGDRLIAYGTFGKSETSNYNTSLSSSYIQVNDTSTVNTYYIKTHVFTFSGQTALPSAPSIFYSFNVIKIAVVNIWGNTSVADTTRKVDGYY